VVVTALSTRVWWLGGRWWILWRERSKDGKRRVVYDGYAGYGKEGRVEQKEILVR
jgi:hypothetical protein